MKRFWIFCFYMSIITSFAFSFGNSKWEYHHIYPRQYFQNTGDIESYVDNRVVKIREFEHLWIHNSPETIFSTGFGKYYKGFDGDWRKVNQDKTIKKTGVIIPLFFTRYAITPYGKRKASIILGSRFISYRFLTKNFETRKTKGLICAEFDFVSNLLYNISYITSIPAKTISFIKFIHEDHSLYQTLLMKFSEKVYLYSWMILHLIWGLLCSIIMLIVGPIIGLICHPLNTIGSLLFSLHAFSTTNLLTTIYDLLVAIIKPLVNIIFWGY